MRIEFTAQEIEAAVRAVAEENPNTVYEQPVCDSVGNTACAYFDSDEEPSCLIGQGLARLGLEAADFTDGNNYAAIAELLNTWDGTPATETRWLSDVQYRQDQGMTWLAAVQYADKLRSERAKLPS